MAALALRFGGKYCELPGLRLTPPQGARLFGIEVDLALAVVVKSIGPRLRSRT